VSWARTLPVTRMLSSNGAEIRMPIPQTASAQPGPNAATHSPAIVAPPIWPPFIARRLMALASCTRSPGTSLGTRACEAG